MGIDVALYSFCQSLADMFACRDGRTERCVE
jgi:hypothetical protein